ncbi:TPA: type II secretion system protein J [Stenotrophomonas maltophilia]|nr:type II secretion system protein J [Stenotrophomonas maltophilia]HDS1026938.1 type II secretion system protein J [Stenotrophomonas maltophilia]HDS1030914.1 type II secretion system protein J [Stenotrophomonas maltophilia]HDS1035798.1 type II secretion system protein J [Stenotrophomonas maltophilia]
MKRRAAGFTLVEVMLATVLLAGGLALAFASVRSAMAVSQRGEQIAADSERMRAVHALLRRQLGGALRSPIEVPDPTREPVFFQGDEKSMQFVADLPGYLGRGGPYLHTLQVDGNNGQRRLLLELVMLQEGERIAETPPRPAEVLAEGLKDVQLRYRGVDPATGQLSDWLPRWDDTRRLPLLVQVQVVPARGAAWPPLVVAPRTGGSGGAR